MYTSPKDITAFDEQDIETVLADELADSEDRYEPVNSPTAVLLAGQPGAGKTELASAMVGMLDYNAFFINADEYRRRHPNYRAIYELYGSDAVQMTSAFSSVVTERLIKAFSNRHLNLIIEGTGRTVEVPKKYREAFDLRRLYSRVSGFGSSSGGVSGQYAAAFLSNERGRNDSKSDRR